MLVQVDLDPRRMLSRVRREVRAVDPKVAIAAERPFADMLQDCRRRFALEGGSVEPELPCLA
jgi:hypothetical protein